MHLILDQGIPRDAAIRLRQLGHECTHVGEVGMSKATDREILALAVEELATIVTLDADFHTMVAVSGALGPSVIRLRVQGLEADAIVQVIQKALSVFQADLETGALVTVKGHKTTCHKLPVGGSDKGVPI
jgi:predicted nuclease of predicted toxin-antitoxin system